ncbi:MAG: recombinase family protein [Promethearchaeota archaeon]
MLGVSTRTLRRWDAAGTITCHRTAGGHRRFSIADLRDSGEERHEGGGNPAGVAVYCRVSSHEQKAKGDLGRQVEATTAHCRENALGEPAVFTDVGSGLNAKRSGLDRLCKSIERGTVNRVIIT